MEQNVLVTKMIGIVVAVIVAAVVLVPICNSLTEGDGGSGGGGGGTGGPYTNTGEYYYTNEKPNDDIVSSDIDVTLRYVTANDTSQVQYILVYEEADSYGDVVRSSVILDKIYNSEEIDPLENGVHVITGLGTIIYDGKECPIYLEMNSSNRWSFGVLFEPGYNEESEDWVPMSFGDQILLPTTSAGTSTEVHGRVWVDWNNLTLQLSYSPTEPSRPNIGCFITTAESATHVYSENPIVSSTEETMFCLYGNSPLIISLEEGSVEFVDGIYSTKKAVDSPDIALAVPSEYYGYIVNESQSVETNVESATIKSTNLGDGAYHVDGIAVSGGGLQYNLPAKAIVPVTIEGSGSGGGSSGGSDLGVAGTIIGIIPVFVILAILMGAVGLFYQNRKTI